MRNKIIVLLLFFSTTLAYANEGMKVLLYNLGSEYVYLQLMSEHCMNGAYGFNTQLSPNEIKEVYIEENWESSGLCPFGKSSMLVKVYSLKSSGLMHYQTKNYWSASDPEWIKIGPLEKDHAQYKIQIDFL